MPHDPQMPTEPRAPVTGPNGPLPGPLTCNRISGGHEIARGYDKVRYRVHFRRQFVAGWKREQHPVESLRLPKGLLRKAIFVEPEPLDNLSSGVLMGEQVDILRMGTEAWEFEIVPDRREEFIRTLRNSGGTVLHYEELGGEAA